MEIPKGEHYNLRWNSYTNNLVQVLSQHQHQEDLVDITFCCEGQFIKAHKLVLSACSEVFQNMFKYHNVPHPVVLLNGIKFNHFKHILEFMYQGEVKVLDIDLEGVLLLGENLQVKGLSSVKLKHQIPPDQVKPKAVIPIDLYNKEIQTYSPALREQNSVNHTQSVKNDVQSNSQPQTKTEKNSAHTNTEIDGLLNNKIVYTKKIPTKTEPVGTKKNTLEKILNNSTETAQRKIIKPEIQSSSLASKGTNVKIKTDDNSQSSKKHCRPASAFMIFANEWRKKLEVEHPEENNKGISVRLGNMWKSLSNETRQSYYVMEMERKSKLTKSTSDEPKPKKIARRKTIDSISHLASVNLQELDDEDDLQIIEVVEKYPRNSPIQFPSKRGSTKLKNT